MKKYFLLILLLSLVPIVFAEEKICVVYFYSDTCPHCANLKSYLDEIENKYDDKIMLTRYELHNLKNYEIYNKFCGVKDIPIEQRKVPLLGINDQFLMGENQIRDNLENEIESALNTGIRKCPLEGEMKCHATNYTEEGTDKLIKGKVTWPLIFVSSLVDGINPCAFAVLIFLLTYLISISNKKRRMLAAGIAYIISVYVTYLLAGFGILTAIQVSGLSGIIFKIAAGIAIIAGIINIKDYFFYGKGFSLKIPESRKSIIERFAYKANIPAAIVLGFLVSMFELPCTGGVYLAILAMLASSKVLALPYLLVYNFIFVLPLIVIMLFIYFGMKAEHIERWRESRKNIMRLILGLILVGLGLIMLFIK